MEYSSPLAAMHPQPVPTWGGRKDVPTSRSMYHGFQTLGPNSFDFNTMSMQRDKPRRPDYFSLRPVRGSSPTASLTADLDANFHIDKSPQVPTPRRSLFTQDLFRPRQNALVRTDTPPIEVEPARTPPIIMSSSPYFEAMDISPLPHKAPCFQVTLPSPSPEEDLTPDIDISPDLLCPEQLPEPAVLQPVPSPVNLELPERRRPVTRPGLSRTKGLSTSHIPQRPTTAETQLPPFRFGNVATSGLSCSSTPSLLESFSESPVDDPRPSGLGSMLPPSRRTSISNANRCNGSPSGNVRRSAVGRPAFVRPQRKLIRRSLSMFQHPDDVMKEEQETFSPQSSLSSVMDIEQESTHKLPFFVPDDEPEGLPRITQETMLDVLAQKYADKYERVLVIDCRFEYEYEGGHIESAVNFNDKQHLASELFEKAVPPSNTLLIFHCEYSVHRAPLTAKFIRGHDRTINAANYPHLTYPEMYILDGGYSKFFAEHPSRCFPQNYVEMNDHRHEMACERGMAKVKQQPRQKLFRNQTFAFGTTSDDMEDSPTALGRALGPRSHSTFTVGNDIAEGIGMSYQRRMASY
ncbi:Putative M-phase inducer phosphatase, Rhodanese-like domain, Rhodanese-like domain superfamily [Septoria linicola]|uniref:M-phase inducer phosphatase n=1 Tax=Septoria linicola TaxID=215465 RepID=A0A9Q9EM86_9PEZI|nr:putative M-phase inducer phosphatase, Rhodanese-like domain, Rhodanese-like domain superfamily [Septoria linicola]USW56566.1 Putative M-phase inducer phosphatase, Rhodanese-like domain, Rhodanese-like domain superfamily [Septoria linicola]